MIRCLSIAIVKPVDCTWEIAGKALSAVSRACMNGANLAQTFINTAETETYRKIVCSPDGRLDLPKKGKKICLPKLSVDSEAYHFVRERLPYLGSRTASYIVQEVKQRYMGLRFSVLTAQKRCPEYKTFPFLTDVWSVEKKETTYILSVSVFSRDALFDNCPPRLSFVLATNKLRGDYADLMDEIAQGKHARCIRIVRNERKKKWMVLFPCEIQPSEHKLVEGRVMHVYPPGNGKLLRCAYFKRQPANAIDDVWREDIEYESAMASRKIYEERRNRISHKYRQDRSCSELPTGAVGHGRKRALLAKEKWQSKYDRRTTTLNQQRAAHIVKLAIRWKCSIIEFLNPSDVTLDGYNLLPSWPWFKLEQSIKNKCEEHGIEFRKVAYDEDVFLKFGNLLT